ncbi:MAG: hypothetical protein KC468_30225 [Myxococcales bacterium]|nr:hypothetical protein [Myxococcales bacterium]
MTNDNDPLAAWSICDGGGAALPHHDAANDPLDPSPGYWADGGALFYTSDRGATWLIRDDAGTAQLTPRELPSTATTIDTDEIVDLDVVALAEVADAIGQAPGVYRDRGHFYLRTDGGAFLLYGEQLYPVELAAIPFRARLVDDVPEVVMDVVSGLLEESA